jgi:galactokinase
VRTATARAPGRVNLIGEHTDYNGGFVMPCAIAYRTEVHARERPDDALTISSPFEDERTARYVEGMVSELRHAFLPVRGMDLRIDGTLPVGAGLSSSASLEIAVALAALDIGQAQPDRVRLAELAQRAEIEFVGTQCGIMDQFAVLFGQEHHALFLDTRSLRYELLEVPQSVSIIICNTMVKHELAATEYNLRRYQCEMAVALLAGEYRTISQLRDISLEELKAVRHLLTPMLYSRALHVVSENERVLRARSALQAGDVAAFGDLMNASHESLRVLYEVSCSELDTMVYLARELDGVYGARMTGGGFGGCTVNLVDASAADEFRSRIARAYRAKTGIEPEIYDGTPSQGAELVHA